jgi:hypothetical protein
MDSIIESKMDPMVFRPTPAPPATPKKMDKTIKKNVR